MEKSLDEMFKGTFIEEIKEVDEFAEPNDPVRFEESILGEMDDLEKRFYTVSRKKGKMAKLLHVELEFGNGSDSEKAKQLSMVKDLAGESNALVEMMWCLIRERIGDAPIGIGVRSGFKIVGLSEEAIAQQGRPKVISLDELARKLTGEDDED